MTILSYTQLCDLIEDGVLENSCYENVNASSIDITLGKIILVEDSEFPAEGFKAQIKSLRRREPLKFKTINLENISDQSFVIQPGQFILAQSQEIFNLPCDISAEYKLKSSMARMGLEHLNAGWCDPGWHGSVLTLEFRNLTTYHHIELRMGDKIGQMVFYKHMPVPIEKSYAHRGTYNKDTETSASKEMK